jgi:methyl-accepting chemotaxis protein
MARKLRYDAYGALAGVGLPLVGTIIEAVTRAAQQQEGGIELALKAMNQISLATEETVTSTQHVAREARELEGLAASLRAATRA